VHSVFSTVVVTSMAGFLRRKWRHDAGDDGGRTQDSGTWGGGARQRTGSGVVVSGPMSLSASRHGRRERDPWAGEEGIDEASSVCSFGSACRQIRRLASRSHLSPAEFPRQPVHGPCGELERVQPFITSLIHILASQCVHLQRRPIPLLLLSCRSCISRHIRSTTEGGNHLLLMQCHWPH